MIYNFFDQFNYSDRQRKSLARQKNIIGSFIQCTVGDGVDYFIENNDISPPNLICHESTLNYKSVLDCDRTYHQTANF